MPLLNSTFYGINEEVGARRQLSQQLIVYRYCYPLVSENANYSYNMTLIRKLHDWLCRAECSSGSLLQATAMVVWIIGMSCCRLAFKVCVCGKIFMNSNQSYKLSLAWNWLECGGFSPQVTWVILKFFDRYVGYRSFLFYDGEKWTKTSRVLLTMDLVE